MGATSKDPNLGFYFIFGLITFFVWSDLSFFGELSEQGSVVLNSSSFHTSMDSKTVKLRMQDHVGHYIYLPFCQWLDETLEVSKLPWISPNVVTITHFTLALIACRLFLSPVLMWRRVAVVMYECRSMLDILDGVVYRAQSHSKTFMSGFGTYGYLMDAAADTLSGIFLVVVTTIRLNRYPPLRYSSDPFARGKKDEEAGVTLLSDMETSIQDDSSIMQNVKRYSRKTVNLSVLFSAAQCFVRAGLWDHFLKTYHYLLETSIPGVSPVMQAEVLDYRSTWAVLWLWKVNSADAFFHFILVALFCNCLWTFLRIMIYIGPPMIVAVGIISQFHVMQVKSVLGV